MRIFLCIIPLFFLFLVSCAAMNDNSIAATWKGKSAKTLVKQMGTPNFLATLSNGNQIYIYRTKGLENYPLPMSNPTTIVSPRGQAVAANIPYPANTGFILCVSTFEVNPQNVIVSAKMEGGGCVPSSSHH